tara:strand:+ start:7204 stop:7539 length:336 start_codon:yes stop_codon:yes gene_type:complete
MSFFEKVPDPDFPLEEWHMFKIYLLIEEKEEDECFPWKGRIINGYGVYNYECTWGYAHRLVWEWVHNKIIPKGAYIRHSCGNKLCQNPSHLSMRERKASQKASDFPFLLSV